MDEHAVSDRSSCTSSGGEDGSGPQLGPLQALIGIVIAFALILTLSSVMFLVSGVSSGAELNSRPWLNLLNGIGSDVAFVASALIVVSRLGPLRAASFGLRRFKASAFGWAALAAVAYLALSRLYFIVVNAPEDTLPQKIGVDEGALLTVAALLFAVAIAPVVEEVFFRGFIFPALRGGIGVWPAAIVSGLLFGAVHFNLIFLAPLALLGTVLALLYQRTGSIWPCVLLHSLNNALAMALYLSTT